MNLTFPTKLNMESPLIILHLEFCLLKMMNVFNCLELKHVNEFVPHFYAFLHISNGLSNFQSIALHK